MFSRVAVSVRRLSQCHGPVFRLVSAKAVSLTFSPFWYLNYGRNLIEMRCCTGGDIKG